MLGIFSSTEEDFNTLTVLGYIHHHLCDKEVIYKISCYQGAFSLLVKWNLMKALGADQHIASTVFFPSS